MSEASAQSGTIHDLKYKAYEGRRTHPLGRFGVIAKYALVFQLRQRSVKVLLALGLSAIVGSGVILALRTLLGPAAQNDGQETFVWLCMNSELIVSFLLVLVCGAPALAADLNAGAFQFHFARPVALSQYLFGRVLSAGGLAFGMCLVSLTVLSLERVALQGSVGSMGFLYSKLLLALFLRVLTYTSVALGLSSLTRRRGLSQAMFAGMVIFTWMFTRLLNADLEAPWILGLSVGGAADMVCDQFMGEAHLRGWRGAVPGGAIGVWVLLSLSLASWRLSRAEVVRG